MGYRLEIEGRNTGQSFKVSDNVKSGVKWQTQRRGAPARLEFTLIKDYIAAYHEGDPVLFVVDDKVVFSGFVFTKRKNDKGEITTTCYDQLRYLKAKQTYNWENYSLTDAVQQIAAEFKLTVGELPNTGYRLPYGHYQDLSLLDIITDYQIRTTIATGKIWNFLDEEGKLTLREAGAMQIAEVLGEGSLATGYTYETSIDKETYNQIKLIRPNEETGRADLYMAVSTETIAKWGLLQLYEIVDENLNAAQIEEMVRQRLTYHNRVSRNLTLKLAEAPPIRAGCIAFIYLPELGDLALRQRLLIESASHTFSADKREATLEMEVVV
ncbi:MAG: hypothetical protein FWF06_03775 [Symbiobacteriaceae bacterium]|nr:hypothetical protein [Symbiobacteriaceae bacterium]